MSIRRSTRIRPQATSVCCIYVSPITGVISRHGARYHQYADDTQMYLSMHVCDSYTEQAAFETCTSAVKHWHMCNHLIRNADKSEVVKFGTVNQLRSAADVKSVSVAGGLLLVASMVGTGGSNSIKPSGFFLDRGPLIKTQLKTQ